MPIEEDDEIIRLNADKTLVCEVNARTVVISGSGSDKLVLERDRATPVNKGDDILNVSGRRQVKTGGEESEHNGNVVILVKGDYTLRVSGNLTIEAGGNLQLKSGKELRVDAVDVNMKAGSKIDQKAHVINTEAVAHTTVKAGAQLEINSAGVLDIRGGMVRIN